MSWVSSHRGAGIVGSLEPVRARARWLVLGLVWILVLAGCQPARPEDGSSRSSATQLLVAVTATSAEPAPTLTNQVVSELSALGLRSHEVDGATVATLVGADREQLPRKPDLVDLTPLRGSIVEHIPDRRQQKVAQAVAALTSKLRDETSKADGLDLLALLDQAGSTDVPHLLVISSGVSTVDPLDFRQLGWNRSVTTVVGDLARRGLLPRHLDGRSVTFVGLGVTAGSQPPLAGPQQVWVEQLWLSICRRAGARQCRLSNEVPAAHAPVTTRPVPVVPVPTVDTTTGVVSLPGGACSTVRRLPARLLFDGDSAALRQDADGALRAVAREVAAGATITEVAGHTADAGAGDGLGLSRQRARAVAERLIDLGVAPDRIEAVVGYGDSHPVQRNYNPDGSFNETLAAKNRRVDITTTDGHCETKNGETK